MYLDGQCADIFKTRLFTKGGKELKRRNAVSRLLQILNFLAFVLVIVVNALANRIPIGGRTTGEIADMYPNLFTPAGFTFAIWGIIYLGLALFALYQAGLLPGVNNGRGVVRDIGWLFILSSLANVSWLLAWHYDMILLSVVFMLLLLVTLIGIYQRVRNRDMVSGLEKWFVRVPFSLYLGWISVATIANITVALVSVNWNGFGISPQIWTVIVILVADLLALSFLARRSDVWYGLVVAWALFGILYRHLTFFAGQYPAVVYTSLISIAVLVLGVILTAWRTRSVA